MSTIKVFNIKAANHVAKQQQLHQQQLHQQQLHQQQLHQQKDRINTNNLIKNMNIKDVSTTINFSITNNTVWTIVLSGSDNNGPISSNISSNVNYPWVGSSEFNKYTIVINDTTTNPPTQIIGELSCGISTGIAGTRGWCDPTNQFESSIIMQTVISGGTLGTVTYTDASGTFSNWLGYFIDQSQPDRFTNVHITYIQTIQPGPPVPPGPGPIPAWTPTVGTKAIYYHQQWDCYGASTLATSQSNGVNIATSTGRNYLISDIPDDVLDIAYAFWYVDDNGNVQSADDWADHDNYLANQTSDSSKDGKIFPWQAPDPGNPPPVNQPANGFSEGNQYPVWRPTRVFGNFGQILALNTARQARGVPPLNTSLTIGGWTFSTYFSSAVNDTNRANFVASCVTALKLWADIFNGINFDWEYISDNGINYGNAGGNSCYYGGPTLPPNQCSILDVINFSKFLTDLRTAINNDILLKTQNIKIGISVTPVPEKAQFDVNLLAGLVDEFHVMTYDFHSGSFPGDTQTGFHSNPLSVINKSNYPTPSYSTIDSIKFYLGLSGQSTGRPSGESVPNVPPSKLFLGIAFYSRGYSSTTGPYQAASSSNTPPNISAPYDSLYTDKGVIPYWQIVTLPTTIPGSVILNDKDTLAAYWVSNDDSGNFLSFDNPTSINSKFTSIVNFYNIGGILAWDNASDIRGKDTNNKSLDTSLTNCITTNIKNKITAERVVSSKYRNTYVNVITNIITQKKK
jgi:chitinase